MKIEILSRKFIKPSTPTPPHLKTMNISVIDQLSPSYYVPMLFYYNPSSSNTINGSCNNHNYDHENNRSINIGKRLEKSLQDILSVYYPLAGRFINDKLIVDCNDEGVEYLEARVLDIQLNQLLHHGGKQPEVVELLAQLIPMTRSSDKFLDATTPLLVVQVNLFNCGGLVISVSRSHKVADGFSFVTFMKEWATMSRVGGGINRMNFVASTLLPARDISWIKPRLPKKNVTKLVRRTFIFSGPAIQTLKGKAKDTGTRVVVVVALIWRTLVNIAKSKRGHFRPSLASLTMNMRGKVFPSVPENCFGNLQRRFHARFMGDESKVELHDFVGLVETAKRNTIADSEKAKDDEDRLLMLFRSIQEATEESYNEQVDIFNFTTLCRFPIYDMDFGWGKNCWVSSGCPPFEFIALMDSNCEGGIEAWVTLDEMDMLQFQQHPDILACVS